MNITLRAGERFFINGAVIRIDRKATIELLNDVTFLLENHVMQAKDATTLARQIYFAVQIMLMDPGASATATALARSLIETALGAYQSPEMISGLRSVAQSLAKGRNFEALKTLRGLFPIEDEELKRDAGGGRRLTRRPDMSVTATSGVASAAQPSATASSSTSATHSLGYNDFLTLLMSEMKNQDPTQPMDPSEMVSQLATVSEVGQSVQTNATLTSLLTATSLSQAESLVGRTVTSSDGSTSGTVASVSVTNSGATATLDQRPDGVARQRSDGAMNEGDAVDLVQQAIWMIMVCAGPAVGAAMAVGVAIALVQALTQVQEMTLTFVPKMIAVLVAASLTASFVGGKFAVFTDELYARIERGYK